MLVTPETHQSAMGPNFAVAESASESYSVTADFRESLLVKLWPVQASELSAGGGGEGNGGGGLGEGGGGEGDGGGGLGDGDGGLGGGDGGSGGDGGEAGGGSLQQASLHFAESDFFLFAEEHDLVHFFWFDWLHHFVALFWSFFLHVFVSLSAVQSFGDGAEAKSTGNHCGGTALISDWRAWAAVELDEIDGLMVLVPVVPVSTRPCQLWRGVVRSPGWIAVSSWAEDQSYTVQAQHACSEE